MKPYQWSKFYIFIPIFLMGVIFSFNFIIDPYSMTSYNLLEIPNKFARDDRKEKVAKLYTEPAYENMLFGSSHVYGINPLMVKKYLGGRSYNSGVGTARIEDHLGFLLYLERINKLPQNVIIGLDFYSFNKNVETNKYFLVNDDLNFIENGVSNNLYLSKFLSLDAFRASYKTLRNFLKDSKDRPRFDSHGTAGGASENFSYYPDEIKDLVFSDDEVSESYQFVKTIKYEVISDKRLEYITDIVNLCDRHSIKCIFLITPLNGQLLSMINDDPVLSGTLNKFKSRLAERTGYYDFLIHNKINDNSFFFAGDAMHITAFTGNLILARLFNDDNVNLPQGFGVFVPRKKTN